jgi:hypothetical protein
MCLPRTRRSSCLEFDTAVTSVLPDWYHGSITIKLNIDQKRSLPAGSARAGRTFLGSAGPAQQFRAIRLEHLPTHLALEELPFLAGLDQASADQLFDMK